MKSILHFLFVLGCGVMSVVGGPSAVRGPATLQSVEIIWSAPTNKWPEALWVYKVEPQNYPVSVISNLLALGSFTTKDKSDSLLGQARFKDKSILYFRNSDESKHLGIYPSLGFVDYNDRSAEARMTEPAVKIPGEEEVPLIALKYLRLLAIDPSQLETKSNSCDLSIHGERRTRGHLDGKGADEVDSRGIFFNRRLDGIPFRGIGLNNGVRVRFGNNAKVIDLQVYWRNLKPYELRECASPDQILHWLKSGQIAQPTQAGPAEQISKITITKAVFLYDGKFGDEMQDFVNPYLNLEAVVENGRGSQPRFFESPIFVPKAHDK